MADLQAGSRFSAGTGREEALNYVVAAMYRGAMSAARALVSVAPAGRSKVWRSLRARRGVVERMQAKAQHVRDRTRPLVWFHAPSVGEGLQARAIIEALQAARPDVQVAYTFYSPSAEEFAASLPADIADYLPLDGVREADALLDALAPSALCFVKLDVWPVLVARAKARGIPVALLSATMVPHSSRRGKLAGLLLRDAYAALDAVGAISENDAARLQDIGVRPSAVSITGDTRFDQVWRRAQTADRTGPLLSPLASERVTLVAGSSWPADEQVLRPAWDLLKKTIPEARLIVAPHEPTPDHIAPLLAWAKQTSNRCGTLSAAPDNWDVLVIDRTGVLGELYALADVAFVGGGFHAAGLHSVLEPAAFGVPVAFGPQFASSREAGLLLHCEGAASVINAGQLATQLVRWMGSRTVRARDGSAARAVVLKGLGAAERSQALVQTLLTSA